MSFRKPTEIQRLYRAGSQKKTLSPITCPKIILHHPELLKDYNERRVREALVRAGLWSTELEFLAKQVPLDEKFPQRAPPVGSRHRELEGDLFYLHQDLL